MNDFAEFMMKVESGEILCDKTTIGLLHVFGIEIYQNYFDLLNNQILSHLGYELLIVKKTS